MALQEVMWPQQGECTLNRGTILYSGRSDGTHRQGVAVYLSHRARRALLRFGAVNERFLKIKLDTSWCRTTVVVVYAPVDAAADEEKDEFYGDLRQVLRTVTRHDMLIFMGDLNAKVGRETAAFPGTIGRHSLHADSNDNGYRLAIFAAEHGLVIGMCTLLDHRDAHKATWVSPDLRTRNQIDHILISGKFRRSLRDVRAQRGADCNSDYFMVPASIHMKLKAGGRPTQKRERIDLDNCKNSDMRQEFRRRANDMVAAVLETGENPIDQWGEVSSALVTNTKETFGLKPK